MGMVQLLPPRPWHETNEAFGPFVHSTCLESLEDRLVLSGPSLTLPFPQMVSEGQTISLAISASDSNPGATLSFSGSGLPAGLSITSLGLISGVVGYANAASGSLVLDASTLSVSDGSLSVSGALSWWVSDTRPLADREHAEQQRGPVDLAGLPGHGPFRGPTA